jgi:putative transposase
LASEYPILWVDAVYERIRQDGRVISGAVLVIKGVTLEGKREVLAVQPMYDESESNWGAVFEDLKTRGLKKVWLVVSDAHRGIQAAVRKHLLGSSWQRCKVHLMRNVMARVAQREKKAFAQKMKQIWVQPDRKSALRMAKIFMAEYRQHFPEAITVLAEGLEDSLQFYTFPEFDPRKVASTNILERMFREVRRRSRVVGVFPSAELYARLISLTERNCIRKEDIEAAKVRMPEAA